MRRTAIPTKNINAQCEVLINSAKFEFKLSLPQAGGILVVFANCYIF